MYKLVGSLNTFVIIIGYKSSQNRNFRKSMVQSSSDLNDSSEVQGIEGVCKLFIVVSMFLLQRKVCIYALSVLCKFYLTCIFTYKKLIFLHCMRKKFLSILGIGIFVSRIECFLIRFTRQKKLNFSNYKINN